MSEDLNTPVDIIPNVGAPDSHEAEIVSIDPARVSDDQARIADLIDKDPRLMEEVKHYFQLLQINYSRRMLEIEVFLGFMEGSADLGTRLHRVETFLGIKP